MTEESSPPRSPRIQSLQAVVGSAVAFGFVLGFLSLVGGRIADRYAPRHPLMTVTHDLAVAVVGAVLLFLLLYRTRQNRLRDLQRFELIAASTEQIRQALQLITDSAVAGTAQQQIALYAVTHIEWVLNEVLPAVHQSPREVRDRIGDGESLDLEL